MKKTILGMAIACAALAVPSISAGQDDLVEPPSDEIVKITPRQLGPALKNGLTVKIECPVPKDATWTLGAFMYPAPKTAKAIKVYRQIGDGYVEGGCTGSVTVKVRFACGDRKYVPGKGNSYERYCLAAKRARFRLAKLDKAKIRVTSISGGTKSITLRR